MKFQTNPEPTSYGKESLFCPRAQAWLNAKNLKFGMEVATNNRKKKRAILNCKKSHKRPWE